MLINRLDLEAIYLKIEILAILLLRGGVQHMQASCIYIDVACGGCILLGGSLLYDRDSTGIPQFGLTGQI